MSFADKVKSDEAYRYDWLQVNTVIPKKPGQHLTASHYSQQQVCIIKYLPVESYGELIIHFYLFVHLISSFLPC